MDPRDEPVDHAVQLHAFALVNDADDVRLAIPYERLRRIEFDLEAGRPSTLVVVPHDPADEPQVLSIPRDQLPAAAEVLAFIGERLR
jgi:hypothetical protein